MRTLMEFNLPVRSLARQPLQLIAALVCAPLCCPGAANAQTWTFSPQLEWSEAYSNNMTLRAAEPLQGFVSDVSPSFRIDGKGARVKANLDYRLDSLHYSGHPELRRNLNSLASFATVEALDHWLYIDASAGIVRRPASSFEPAALQPGEATSSESEVTTVMLSPYIRGQLSSFASYQLRFNAIASRGSDRALADSRVRQWIGSIGHVPAGEKIGWFVDGSATQVHNDLIGGRADNRARAGMIVEVLPRVHVSVFDGIERSNYAQLDARTTTSPGLGIDWNPDPLTRITLLGERRFFGMAHSVLLSHASALTTWRYSDVRDAATLPLLLAASGQGATDQLLSDLIAANVVDPVTLKEVAPARPEQNDRTSSRLPADGIQTSRLFVYRRREATVLWRTPRNTVSLGFTRRDQEALGDGMNANDSFNLSNRIRERGVNLSWIHRLTPLATLTLSAARLRSEGLDTDNLVSNQFAQTASIVYQLGPKASASFGLRRMQFNSTINGTFSEHAVVAALSQRF